MIPEEEMQVSILGEKLTVERLDGTATYSSPGRPIAIISNVMIEYRPGPPPKPAAPAKPRQQKAQIKEKGRRLLAGPDWRLGTERRLVLRLVQHLLQFDFFFGPPSP